MDSLNRKRIFIALLLLSVLVISGIWYVIHYIQNLDNPAVRNTIFTAFSLLVFLAILVFLMAIGILVLSLMQERYYSRSHKIIRGVIDFLFPVSLFLGKLIGIEADQVKGSYVNVCNQVVKTREYHLKPEEILILAPHCLQNASCPHKITIDVNNCRMCGKCTVGDLLALQRETGVNLVIATGGTFARKLIKEKKPKAIVAVACERDLTSGIQDVKVIPVLGVLNQRPEGPCYNTLVDIPRVREAIDFFLGKDPLL